MDEEATREERENFPFEQDDASQKGAGSWETVVILECTKKVRWMGIDEAYDIFYGVLVPIGMAIRVVLYIITCIRAWVGIP